MISIIVPVYNTQEYLENCIESILKQTYPNFELILVNDGSTDNSLLVCEDYARKDSRIILLNKSNGGLSSARNFGLDYAKGEYIVFIDSDDKVSLDLIEQNIKILEKDKNISILQFPIFRKYGKSDAYIFSPQTGKISGTVTFFKEWIENNRISWNVCDKFFKREIFNKIRFIEGMLYEDNYLMSDILEVTENLYISDKGLYYYYNRSNTITTSPHTFKKDLDTQKVSLRILKSLIRFENLNEAKIIMLSRILNVYLSLSKNYQKREFDDMFIQEIGKLKISSILKSGIDVKEKVKLILLKSIGIGNYILFY